MTYLSDELFEKSISIINCDDKEKFVEFFRDHQYALSMSVFEDCAICHAKKCLIAMIQGEVGFPAVELYNEQPYSCETTPLAMVACYFPDLDVIALMLKRGALQQVNTKCYVCQHDEYATPLSHALFPLSFLPHIYPWIQGDSLFKLIILLCQWNTKLRLDIARMLAPLTDSINDIAWTFVRDGNLVSFAALLLVTREKALAPFDSATGFTIQNRITKMIDALKTEGEDGREVADYTSMLMDACKLLDIFEMAGDKLSLYCSSLRKSVAPDKVLTDVVGILKKADFSLQPVDIDLRDCYRGYDQLWDANLFKLSDLPSPKIIKHVSLPYQALAHGSGAALYKIPYGDSYLRRKLISGSVVSFTSPGSLPRLLSTAAGRVGRVDSSIAWKHLSYAAMKLKRGMRLL